MEPTILPTVTQHMKICKYEYGDTYNVRMFLRLNSKYKNRSMKVFTYNVCLSPILNSNLGSGCHSVGRAVSSDARGLWFESSHQRNFILDIYLFTVNSFEKTKIMEKRPGTAIHLKLTNKQF